jgi:predicted dehydrogenase
MELFGTESGATLKPLMAYRCDDNKEEDIKLRPTDRMESWDRIADHFISCILDGIDCEAPLKHGLMVQKMMEGLLRSAEIGQPVTFE